MYTFANLFVKPVNNSAFELKYKDVLGGLSESDRLSLLEDRLSFVSRPWAYASGVKELIDAPYVTNLPLTLDLVLCSTVPHCMRPFRMMAFATTGCSNESPAARMADIRIDSGRLSSLSLHDIFCIKQCNEAQEYTAQLRSRFANDANSVRLSEAIRKYCAKLRGILSSPEKFDVEKFRAISFHETAPVNVDDRITLKVLKAASIKTTQGDAVSTLPGLYVSHLLSLKGLTDGRRSVDGSSSASKEQTRNHDSGQAHVRSRANDLTKREYSSWKSKQLS